MRLKLPKPLRRRLAKFKRAGLYAWAKYRPLPRKRAPHTLPAPLIVSLTSYPPRFGTLAATLRALLAQSVKPDELILWVAHEDLPSLPHDVRALTSRGLTICATEDMGSYTKIIPALDHFPDAFIATADDDTYYGPSWLADLVAGYDGDGETIVCRRAHKIILDDDGRPLPYLRWERNTDSLKRSKLLFPTGVGGVLYPPGSFHSDVLRSDVFSKLSPNADDVWLYWMARLNNRSFRRVDAKRRLHSWPNSQDQSLWSKNKLDEGGNDDQIKQLASKYGFPFE